MKDLKWPAVAIIVPLLGILGILAWHEKDATMVISGVLLVLGALGFAHMSNKQTEIQETAATIKEQTNGRIGQLTAMIEKQTVDLARVNEDHNRAMANLADQNRADMKEMAEVLARMMPPPEPPISVSGGGANSSDI